MRELEPWVAGGISILWALSIVWQMFHPTYTIPPYVHGAFMLMAGSFWGRKLLGRNGND